MSEIEQPTGVTDTVTGWMFVACQVVLLAAMVLLPGREDWPTPRWVELVGVVVVAAGLVLVVVAAGGLGRSLTPTPVPKADGALRTTGLYGVVRHPIYSGVLAAVAGMAIRSGSVITLAVAVVTFCFFGVKARWEEKRLTNTYPDYPAYARRVPRFFPLTFQREHQGST